MTDFEKMISSELQKCSVLPGSWEKRFIRQLPSWEDREMTPQGRASLIRCFCKYHAQIPDFMKICSLLTKARIL